MKMKCFVLTLVMLAFTCTAFGQSSKTTTIKVYFSNEKLNPNIIDCNKV